MILNSPYITGSLTVTGNIIASGSITLSGSVASASYALTASNAIALQGLGSASFAPSATFNTVSSSFVTVSGSYASASGSLSTRVTNLESTSSTVSSSFATTSGSIAGRVTCIEGQYATTGSNNFTRPQQISDVSNAISFTSTASLYTAGGLRVSKDSFVSGTAYFNNVVVYGTSSIQYITSSQVNIGTNIITVNTDTPAVRFGGLAVFDSGSTALTGSLLWDSQNNRWIYSNPSGSTYDGGMLISGPRNTTGLGNEVGTTACAVMMGQGADHITSSGIFSYANATCFYGQSFISSSGAMCIGGSFTGTNAAYTGSVNVTGSFCVVTTAAELQVGATGVTLGNVLTDVHQVTGSLRITGSMNISNFISSSGNLRMDKDLPDIQMNILSSSQYARIFFLQANNGYGGLQLIGSDFIGTRKCRLELFGPNAGMSFVPNGQFESPVMFITGSNVGIGTTSPSQKLEVYGSIAIGASGTNDIIWGTAGGIKLSRTNVGPEYALSQRWTGALAYIDIASSSLWNGGVTILPNGGGNVGIGTASPTEGKLVVANSGPSIIYNKETSVGVNSIWNSSDGSLVFFGSISNHPLQFLTNNSNAMRITSGGAVGIGTTSPAAQLDVCQIGGNNTKACDALYLRAGNNSDVFCSNQILFSYNGGTDYAHAIKTRHNSNNAIDNAFDFYTWRYGDAAATKAGQYVMTVAGNGRVGIGTCAPSNKLQVNVSSNLTTLYGDDSYPLQIKNTSTTNNSYVGMYLGTGNGVGATIQAIYPNASASTEAILSFSTRNSGGSLDERMRITSGGSVCIGTAAVSGEILRVTGCSCLDNYISVYSGTIQMFLDADKTNNAGIVGTQSGHPLILRTSGTNKLSISTAGVLDFPGSNSTATSASDTLSFGVSGATYAWIQSWGGRPLRINELGNNVNAYGTNGYGLVNTTASDVRIKKNIISIENALDKVNCLRGVYYEFDENNSMCMKVPSGKRRVGLIAQEVACILPEALLDSKDNSVPLSLDYSGMVGLLTKAIQEQQCKIKTLESCLGIS